MASPEHNELKMDEVVNSFCLGITRSAYERFYENKIEYDFLVGQGFLRHSS